MINKIHELLFKAIKEEENTYGEYELGKINERIYTLKKVLQIILDSGKLIADLKLPIDNKTKDKQLALYHNRLIDKVILILNQS